MKIAFQMEPMNKPENDFSNSLLLMKEALSRGYDVFHYCPEDLSLSLEGVFAPIAAVSLDETAIDGISVGLYERAELSAMDVIFFRQNPPFDMSYFTNTAILDFLKQKGVLFVNDPYWIRNMPDKISIFDFKALMPPTLIARNEEEIERFLSQHGTLVVKPLYSFHGHGIVKAPSMDEVRTALSKTDEPLMFQPFLKEVFDGNKRVIFYDGEIVGAINSIPPSGGEEFRIYRDSVDVACALSDEDLKACARIGAVLKARDLIFVGIDFIGPYLTEINVGSVGSLARFNEVYGGCWEGKLWDVIERKIDSKTV